MTEGPALGQTPSQTVGPYFTMRLSGEGENVLHTAHTVGQRIRIEGRVFDGDGKQVEDALIEIWQADSDGQYVHPDDQWPLPEGGFTGFGRAASGFRDGAFRFDTIKPGAVPAADGSLQAPHIAVIVQARGMLNSLYTRIYFADEAPANAADPVLAGVPEHRRPTLIAAVVESADASVVELTYSFDIRLQGEDETVFFDV
jgi:protocatechuate 3,4-dioxygenase, alpha subunit